MESSTLSEMEHDLIEACAQAGCPVCRLTEASVSRYLDALMYELVNDIEMRDRLRRSLGFCNTHAHQLLKAVGVSLGIAILYRDLVNTALKQLEQIKFASARGLTLRAAREALDRDQPSAATEQAVAALTPPESCPACAYQADKETRLLTVMLDSLQDERLRTALQASAGLCLPHLRRAFELARNESAFETLVALARDRLAALRAELDEFIRKNDYRFRDEGFGPEGDSWRRAIAQMVGREGTRKL